MKIAKLSNGKYALAEQFDEGTIGKRWRVFRTGTRAELMNWIRSHPYLTTTSKLESVPRIEVAKLQGRDVLVETDVEKKGFGGACQDDLGIELTDPSREP